MIIAGTAELDRLLTQYRQLPGELAVTAIWLVMDETRTKWEQLRTQNISPGDA